MVQGQRVVCLDRRRRVVIDEAGVVEKFGVGPQSIPDYLALVGDAADGIRGLRGGGRNHRRQRCSGTGGLRICLWRSPSGT